MKHALLLILGLFALASLAQADDSLNVRTVGSWPYYFAYSVAIDTNAGHRYAVTGFGGGIFLLDVDSVDTPTKIGEAATNGYYVEDIAIQNHLAFLAAREKGLWVVDINDPVHPQIKGRCGTTANAHSIAVSGAYAYVACDTLGLLVFSVADPLNPALVGACNTPGISLDVVLKDTLALVADDASGLRIINVKDPTVPYEIGHYDSISVLSIVSAGRYVYCSDWLRSIVVIDISDPAHPRKAGAGGQAYSEIGIYDTLAFTGGIASDMLRVNGISDSTNPYLISTLTTSDLRVVRDMAFSPGYMYVADDQAGLRIYNISDPAHLVEVGHFDPPVIWGKGAVSGGRGFFPTERMHIMDLADPSMPHEVGFYNSDWGGFAKIVLKDSFAFAAEAKRGLRILKVSDATRPVTVDTVPIPGVNPSLIAGLAVKDTFVYYASDSLYVINVANVDSPYIVSRYKTTASAIDVTVNGNIAYVAAGSSGLRIVDVSNAAAPSELGYFDTPGTACDVALRDSFAYVADGDSGLRVINVANPANPVERGSWSIGIGSFGGAQAVALDGKLAYVAYDTFGLRVVNISDPANPYEVGHYYIASGPNGDFSTFANGVSIWNGNAYVSYFRHGLQVFHYYGPTGVNGIANDELRITTTMSPNRPNPFTTRTAISYQLSAVSNVTLIVYNVMGQQVKTLASGLQQAGPHQITWNGRNDEGRQLAAGVYFCRLNANNKAITTKMVKVQ